MALPPGIIVQVVGTGAALCSMTSFIPQLLKLWRNKASQGVSLRMYGLTVSAFALWSVYGMMLASWPLMVSNLVSLALSSAILALDLRYRDRAAAASPPHPEAVSARRS